MGNVAGSGGYYIAMGAEKIFAEPGTLTGSIGVVGGKLVTGGLYDKLGHEHRGHQPRARTAARFRPTQPFTPEERKVWTAIAARDLPPVRQQGRRRAGRWTTSKLEALAQGRVYTGRKAKKLGLVDELGTLADAMAAAKKAAGLKPDAEVELHVLPEPKSFFEQLFGDPSAATDFESLLPEFFQTVRQSRVLRQLLSERVLLWMPYGVQVK